MWLTFIHLKLIILVRLVGLNFIDQPWLCQVVTTVILLFDPIVPMPIQGLMFIPVLIFIRFRLLIFRNLFFIIKAMIKVMRVITVKLTKIKKY